MWNYLRPVVCLLIAFLTATSPVISAPQISTQQVDAYLNEALEHYASENSKAWEDRMYRALKTSRDPDQTAQVLAEEDHIAVEHEKALISLWMVHSLLQESRFKDGGSEELEPKWQSLRRAVLDTLEASKHSPLVIQVAARILSHYTACALETFDALTTGSQNKLDSGLAAAREAGCTSWWLTLHARFPANRAVLAELSLADPDLSLAQRLAVLGALNSRSASDPQSRLSILQEYISQLWRAGFVADGLAMVKSASESDRRLLLNDGPVPAELILDGVTVAMQHDDRGKPFTERQRDFRLDYIAALYVTGQRELATRAFERLEYTNQVRSVHDCFESRPQQRAKSDPCEAMRSPLATKLSLLDYALNRRSEDPYPLIEAAFAGTAFSVFEVESALWIEAIRRFANGANYQALWRELRLSWAQRTLQPQFPEIKELIGRSMDARLQKTADSFEHRILALVTNWKAIPRFPSFAEFRRSRTPVPLRPGFRELSIPDHLRTVRVGEEEPGTWPSRTTPLPKGFFPVRIERGSPLTIAVSLSQNLDPTGEASAGGYWIHLSRDEGISWDEPLYTGLPQYFPYIVLPSSKMPLLSADKINLEVAVKELDTATIMYPPVALRSRRQAADLYLEIPLSVLKSDTDNDGLTDIVEEHLLLRADNADSDGDGIDDGGARYLTWRVTLNRAVPAIWSKSSKPFSGCLLARSLSQSIAMLVQVRSFSENVVKSRVS